MNLPGQKYFQISAYIQILVHSIAWFRMDLYKRDTDVYRLHLQFIVIFLFLLEAFHCQSVKVIGIEGSATCIVLSQYFSRGLLYINCVEDKN